MSSEGQEPGPPPELTPARRSQMDQHQADQDRTLAAMRQLEAALAAAAPRREQAWRRQVCSALAVLAEAASVEAGNAALPDSLLSDVARSQPWLRNRVRALRMDAIPPAARQHHRAADRAGRARRPGSGLRRPAPAARLDPHRAPPPATRESDLIYEAYYDAFGSDIALDASRAPDGR